MGFVTGPEVLADELPSSVESAVEGFLRGIDARRTWSMSPSASMLPETRRSDREEVLIGGVPFRLDEDARSSSGAVSLHVDFPSVQYFHESSRTLDARPAV